MFELNNIAEPKFSENRLSTMNSTSSVGINSSFPVKLGYEHDGIFARDLGAQEKWYH